MADPVAIVGVGLAGGSLLLAAGSFFYTDYRFRAARRSRRAIGPGPEIRALLVTARTAFEDIVAHGGLRQPYFLDVHPHLEEELRDAAERVDDGQLREALRVTADHWEAGMGVGPTKEGIAEVINPDNLTSTPLEIAQLQSMQEQVKVARTAGSVVSEGLARFHFLELEAIT